MSGGFQLRGDRRTPRTGYSPHLNEPPSWLMVTGELCRVAPYRTQLMMPEPPRDTSESLDGEGGREHPDEAVAIASSLTPRGRRRRS